MRVIVLDSRRSSGPWLAQDFAVLYEDNWDDFGFKTTFTLELRFKEQSRPIDLGYVKILQLGMGDGGRVVLPQNDFETLPENFCSLGQSFSFYETLLGLDRTIAESVLKSLRDVVRDQQIRAIFERERGFSVSLLRENSARRALEDAPALFGNTASLSAPIAGELKFDFVTSVGGSVFPTGLSFGDEPNLPTRINAVIGYNGCGKTRLLASLAMVASLSPKDRNSTRIRDYYGEIFGQENYAFGATIAVSYSAFDTFAFPGAERNEESEELKQQRVEDQGGFFNYYYFGLRAHELPGNASTDRHYKLKSTEDLTNEFVQSLRLAQLGNKVDSLKDTLRPLLQEPSFLRAGQGAAISHARNDTEVRELFESMSTGHKIALSVAVHLVARLENRSLVLIDEPEAHLHPPLVAALLRSINSVLHHRDSFAIVATHSPVVIQEIPRRQVHILRRFGNITTVQTPVIETFGESVSLLTHEVFNLDSTATDFHSTLSELAENYSLPEIEQMFGGQMSSQARAFVVSRMRRRRAEA